MADSVASTGDLRRLEDKIDKLADAVVHLARIDERQIAASRDTGDLTARVAVMEEKQRSTDALLKAWINRGIGAWAIFGGASTLFALVKLYPWAP